MTAEGGGMTEDLTQSRGDAEATLLHGRFPFHLRVAKPHPESVKNLEVLVHLLDHLHCCEWGDNEMEEWSRTELEEALADPENHPTWAKWIRHKDPSGLSFDEHPDTYDYVDTLRAAYAEVEVGLLAAVYAIEPLIRTFCDPELDYLQGKSGLKDLMQSRGDAEGDGFWGEKCYLLRKGGAFYRPNASGYTDRLAEAGLYTLEEASGREYPHDEPVTKHHLREYVDDLATLWRGDTVLSTFLAHHLREANPDAAFEALQRLMPFVLEDYYPSCATLAYYEVVEDARAVIFVSTGALPEQAKPEDMDEADLLPWEGFDFVAHLKRQKAFSEATFGPGPRAKAVVDHIRKELVEIEAKPEDLEEWIDVAMLALDGAWRAGYSPKQIAKALGAKLEKNLNRDWPDWRTQDPDKAIEHVREGSDQCLEVRDQSGAEAIDFAKRWMVNLMPAEYQRYIRDELAGDFAVELQARFRFGSSNVETEEVGA